MDDGEILASALAGIRIVSLASNVPGPVACATLRDLGASIVKFEAPAGDPLARAAPAWYAALHREVRVIARDLKGDLGANELSCELARADVLLTAQRLDSLARLRCDRAHLARYPRLIHVAIVGESATSEGARDRGGHDLTYVASAGLATPPAMPRTLLADLAGAERAVSRTLALLFARNVSGRGARAIVELGRVARDFAEPARAGLTDEGGVLGGSFAGYRFYRARDGWIAVAALESHFWRRLCDALGTADASELATIFKTRDARAWQRFGDESDIPIVAVARA